jgi:chromosome segregation protein
LVYIKKLEIYGFKSFGFKNAVLNLERGLIAITGPNGSGKSNILDAIMFAIGENSPKSLRVDRFQSLFHDSQNSSNRVIRVSLTFDNQDRGIPVDKDSVVLTREIEGQTGESQYFLNGKKVAKNIITELLEIVVATPNKLNIVQQGMITRISELNSEERRKIIEDIIGLSYFDEKKTEALNQLDASDRRLEIALARIGEIRKRIDELEIERNEQLRFSQVEQEIKRFNAAKLSDYITKTRISLRNQQELLHSKIRDSTSLSNKINQLHSEIERLEAEKMKFLQEVDVANKTKSQIGSRISQIIYDYERKKAIAKESEQRCIQIKEKILPSLDIEIENISKKLSVLKSDLDKKQNPIFELTEKQSSLKHGLDITNSEIDALGKYSMQASKAITRLEQRNKQLEKIKNDIHVIAIGLEEKIKSKSQLAINNDNRISTMDSEINEMKNHLSAIYLILKNKNRELEITKMLIVHLESKKIKVSSEIKDLELLLRRASGLIAEYDSHASVAKNMMNEDLAIAEITKLEQGPAIKGLVCDLISWEKRYEKSILAAGADLMKAFVVDDVGSMLSVLEYAKSRRLPRLKIISLDLLKQAQKKSKSSLSGVDENDTNIIGTLDNFVHSEFARLPAFLFGHTYLVKTARSAYLMAKQGYRAVSVDGELFEPLGSLISADFGSKIAYFGEAILLVDSVEVLRNSTRSLKRLIEDKEPIVRNVSLYSTASEGHKTRLEAEIIKLEAQKSVILDNLNSQESNLQELIAENGVLKSEINSENQELKTNNRRLSILSCTLNDIAGKINSLNNESTGKKLAQANWTRNTILKSMDDTEYQLREHRESLRSLENEIEISVNRIENLKREKDDDLGLELKEKNKQVLDLHRELALQENELKGLRDQEQQIIDSSGASFTVLQEYEKNIRTLTDNDRKTTREYHNLEKDIAVLKKDIVDLESKEFELTSSLNQIGYDSEEESSLEGVDVEETIQQLTREYESLRPRINLRAHDNYVQVIEGYRGMSSRKNQLEEERNSIVLFVEEIDKEKKNVFMEAFKKVDTNLRMTFSEVSGDGGHAWLEIENLEDIFSNGIMLMVQFPGKSPRESTILSGGEKTMAGTVFLLALQSLKPSPFYLLDEVDAHLDSQNTDRLSRVLLSRSLESNQIIMVTLKDSTVSKAGLVYGVYPREGVSQIVKYKQNNQQAIAEIHKSL